MAPSDYPKQQYFNLTFPSPYVAEFMGKYRSKDISESVREITVKWAAEGRDNRVFVKETLVTEENIEPVLRMMAVGVGKDVFDVKVKVQERKTEEKKAVERKAVDWLKGGFELLTGSLGAGR
jgi:hypothetical protein